VLIGLGFLAFGAAYALWPSRMAAITELALPTPTARTDFAATYGGFQIGLGCFLLVCTRSPAWTEPGLWAGAAALAGIAAVRATGVLLARGHVALAIWAGLGIEVTGLALTLWALWQVPARLSPA
jgi:hypothetical protein